MKWNVIYNFKEKKKKLFYKLGKVVKKNPPYKTHKHKKSQIIRENK